MVVVAASPPYKRGDACRTWGQPSFRIVIPSETRDLYCPAGICVYAPRGNDVLVLSHIRQ